MAKGVNKVILIGNCGGDPETRYLPSGGATRKNYMMKLLCERLTGTQEDFYQNAAMQRGTELEPVARSAY